MGRGSHFSPPRPIFPYTVLCHDTGARSRRNRSSNISHERIDTISERLILGLKTFAAPGNVERKYATKVGGTSATLAHYLEKAKTAVKEESGFLEFELAAGTTDASGVPIPNSAAQKFALNVNDLSSVIEY